MSYFSIATGPVCSDCGRRRGMTDAEQADLAGVCLDCGEPLLDRGTLEHLAACCMLRGVQRNVSGEVTRYELTQAARLLLSGKLG